MTSFRRLANEWVVRVQVYRQGRRDYKSRFLVVSNHWDGSVQVFYHFLLGYLLPLTRWITRVKPPAIAVRDCGPMNPWFELLPGHVDVQIIQPGVALHVLAGKRSRRQVVMGMDYPTRFNGRKLRQAADQLCQDLPSAIDETTVLVIDRASSDEFHSGPLSETEMSGARRRSVPNLRSVWADIPPIDNLLVIDPAQMSPTEQITAARAARILIAQHGSGLAHMVWMPEGSSVIEIQPPLPSEASPIFPALARALGHRYFKIEQAHVHGTIDSDQLAATLTEAMTLQGLTWSAKGSLDS